MQASVPSVPVSQASTRQLAPIGEKKWPDIPLGFQLIAEFGLTLNEFGTYSVKCDVELPGGETLTRTKPFYLVKLERD